MNSLSIFRPKKHSIDLLKKFFFLSNVQIKLNAKEKDLYSHPGSPYFLIVSYILLFIKPGMFVLRRPLTVFLRSLSVFDPY